MDKAKALKIEVEFYCTREGPCNRNKECIRYLGLCAGGYPIADVCPFLIVKAESVKEDSE